VKTRASAEHPMHWWVNCPGLMVKALAALEEVVQNGDLTHDGGYRLTGTSQGRGRVIVLQ